MTQQSHEVVQRRRNITTLVFLGVLLSAAAVAVFSSPGAKQVSPEPPAPVAKPAPAKPAPPPPKPAPAKPAKPPPPPLVDEKVLWEDPPEWKRLPSSGMRYASYAIPAAKGDKIGGELNVFILGGDVESNIQRWVDEFSNFDSKTLVRTNRKVNDLPQSIVEIPKGHFSGGMGDTKASDNYGLLGAIVEPPSGAKFFFKLTAPSKAVKEARKPFYKMLDTIRVEKGAANPAGAKAADAPAAAPPAAAQPAPATGAAGAAAHP